MDAHVQEWLSLGLRWFHLIAGISWIGSSFYFMWLDANLTPPAEQRKGVEGELWMVHSGGFYQVEKRLIGPGSMPSTLHWFKWEALLTWVSGMFLLGLVYYVSGGIYLLGGGDTGIRLPTAIGTSLGVIALSWLIYDGLWASRLAERHATLLTAISVTLLLALIYFLCSFFSGRAAFIHVGAVLGTIMVANVWIRILPAQQQMIDATKAGQTPDYTLGHRAKRRSVHNSYVTLPVIFMMISNHYPSTYGHAWNWLILALMVLVGATIRHVMLLHTKGRRSARDLLGPALGVVLLIAVLIYLTAPTRGSTTQAPTSTQQTSDADIAMIIQQRCVSCHGQTPTDDVFTVPPNGIIIETPAHVRALADRILLRVIDTETMPLANKTGMTPDERATLGHWLQSGESGDRNSADSSTAP